MEIPTKIKNKKPVAKRREQIVHAVIKLFSRKGFHETNLRELAEESGISHGNIYYYISSKQDMFFLIHEFINNIAIKKINRSIQNIDDPLDRFRRMVRAEFDLMHEWSDTILLIYQEIHTLNKPLQKALLKRERERVHRIEETIDECIMKGQLRSFNLKPEKENNSDSVLSIQENLGCVQRLAAHIQKAIRNKSSGRIVYLAPWTWDKDLDPIGFRVAKTAIIEFTKSMSRLLADVATTVNCIVPDYIGGVRPLKAETERSPEAIGNVPMGSVGKISDVFEAFIFMISDKSKYLTGQVLMVTGGME